MSLTNTWFVIINPAAGSGKAGRKWQTIALLLEKASINHHFSFTKRKGHAAILARGAVRRGYRKIIAVGGDGTNNEVMNGIMKQSVIDPKEVTFAVIPVGTGNDWIRTHGIKRNIQKAIDIIKRGNIGWQDIGMATYMKNGQPGKRYFMNVAGMAYDAFVVQMSAKKRNLLSNKIFYLYLVLNCLWKYKLHRAKLLVDGKVWEQKFYVINVGICRYSGGGMQFVPHAVPDDGQFAVTFAGELSKAEVIRATPVFYNGKVANHPKVTTIMGKSVEVETLDNLPTMLEVDGEFLGVSPIKFQLLEKSLRIVVP